MLLVCVWVCVWCRVRCGGCRESPPRGWGWTAHGDRRWPGLLPHAPPGQGEMVLREDNHCLDVGGTVALDPIKGSEG